MGHLAGKSLYRKLGAKIDGLTIRAPWNDAFYEILKSLYSLEEAEVAINMPYGLSNLSQIVKSTRYDRTKLQKILNSLSQKGLVMDIWMKGEYFYLLSPL